MSVVIFRYFIMVLVTSLLHGAYFMKELPFIWIFSTTTYTHRPTRGALSLGWVEWWRELFVLNDPPGVIICTQWPKRSVLSLGWFEWWREWFVLSDSLCVWVLHAEYWGVWLHIYIQNTVLVSYVHTQYFSLTIFLIILWEICGPNIFDGQGAIKFSGPIASVLCQGSSIRDIN